MIDEVRITVSSGDGGDGASAFRREKFVPRGGPSGGDGGRGGDIVLASNEGMNTLHHLRFVHHFKAKNGVAGGRAHKTGKAGEDRRIELPVGTLVFNDATGAQLFDLAEHGQEVVVAEGGQGGRGNARFSTPSQRAPTRSEPGAAGQTLELRLELKLLADVGLVGLPNAGKSTFVSSVSAARPKVAAYPFTTLQPSLGVVAVPGDYRTFVVADIPGLVEGAADGAGLGHRFLRHVERCAILLHLVSMDPLENEVYGSPTVRFERINAELERYDSDLAQRPQKVLLSKIDLADSEALQVAQDAFAEKGIAVHPVSSVTREGIDALIYELASWVDGSRERG